MKQITPLRRLEVNPDGNNVLVTVNYIKYVIRIVTLRLQIKLTFYHQPGIFKQTRKYSLVTKYFLKSPFQSVYR